MCGIVGFTGEDTALPILLDGLRRLEYRGYDSAGVATAASGALHTCKNPGKIAALTAKTETQPLPGGTGIGHTRWATHGGPTEANAHPHFDGDCGIAVVHNGIIENYRELRAALLAEGVCFRSETDSEVLPHLFRKHYRGRLLDAVRAALDEVQGAYALAVICADEPGVLVGARQGSPLVVGIGDGAHYLASDVQPLLPHTRQVIYLGTGELCELTPDTCHLETLAGGVVPLRIETAGQDEAAADKAGYPHFMLKEIHQQPAVLERLLGAYTQDDRVVLPELGGIAEALPAIRRIQIVACGTAWHAGLIGKYLIETFARVPVEVDVASEFRYRNPVLDSDTLVIPVSQSGETADTLEAVRLAKAAGAMVLGVINVPGSSIAREADGLLYLQAGPEIGVASTKAYTAQIMVLALFALQVAALRGMMDAKAVAQHLVEMRGLPGKVQWAIDRAPAIEAIARLPRYAQARNAMFIGRGFNFPSALEGALKLKEISYIHVEGYAAGEMKHGPIALVTDGIPVVCIATQGPVYDKLASNIQEIRARNGHVLSIATEGDAEIAEVSDDVIHVPPCTDAFSPLVVASPLQLFAYYVALALGRDVDQPRNLAKSVTVE